MKTLEKIRNKCKKFNLIAEYVNPKTLKIYSTKYQFDTWLVKIEHGKVCLYHKSKKSNKHKCNYHLQREFNLVNWFWCIEHINSHNKFVINRKHYRNTHWVDEILRKHNQKVHRLTA